MPPLLLLLIVLALGTVLADEPGVILTSGQHFDDIVRNKDGAVARDTLLILYHKTCPPEISFGDLPGPHHMYFFTYGVENTLQYTWFQLRESDDLYRRYKGESDACQYVLFFKKNSGFLAKPLRWTEDSDMTPMEWVWAQIQVTVTVKNSLKDAVLVESDNRGVGPELAAGRVEPKETSPVHTYPGHTISVRHATEGNVLTNLVVGAEDQFLSVDAWSEGTPMETLLEADQALLTWWHDYQRATACRHLATMKQPLLVPGFTERGYEKMSIPPMIHKDVHSAFFQNYRATEPENIFSSKQSPFVYIPADTKTKVFPLPDDVVDALAAELKPILEAWCDCTLTFTGADGVREGYLGDVIFRHVGEIETQVISALLQVEQELASSPWKIQLVGSDGGKQEVTMETGEMLVYEAAKVILGRPEPFAGHAAADVTLHFAPTEGWGWRLEDMEYVNVKTGFREPLGSVVTDLTTNKKEQTDKEEL